MNFNLKYSLLFLSLLFLISACEYERIADPEVECNIPILVIESVENTSCAESSGEIVAEVDGQGEYEYSLNGGDFSDLNVFTGLSAGTYNIQARVANTNCISEEVQAVVNNEDGLQIELAETKDTGCGENSGIIRVSQEGGAEPIEYILNNEITQSESEFTELGRGSYTVVARDANGCEAEIGDIEIFSDISFANDIKSIIATNCAVNGCHNGTQSPNFSVDENIFQNASRIKSRTSSETMPPAGRPDLTAEEIEAIACWVDDGALDN